MACLKMHNVVCVVVNDLSAKLDRNQQDSCLLIALLGFVVILKLHHYHFVVFSLLGDVRSAVFITLFYIVLPALNKVVYLLIFCFSILKGETD